MFSIVFLTVGLGILGWVKGFTNSDHVPKDVTLKFLVTAIRPPKIFYWLCGSPRSKKYPKGIMTAWAFLAQFLGVGLLLHTLFYLFLAQNLIDILLSLLFIITTGLGFTYWLTKQRAYK